MGPSSIRQPSLSVLKWNACTWLDLTPRRALKTDGRPVSPKINRRLRLPKINRRLRLFFGRRYFSLEFLMPPSVFRTKIITAGDLFLVKLARRQFFSGSVKLSFSAWRWSTVRAERTVQHHEGKNCHRRSDSSHLLENGVPIHSA